MNTMNESTVNSAPAAPPAVSDPPVSGYWLGGWVFIPLSLGYGGVRQGPYLERDDERVPLPHCSTEPKEFAEMMTGIETKFSRRHGDRAEPG